MTYSTTHLIYVSIFLRLFDLFILGVRNGRNILHDVELRTHQISELNFESEGWDNHVIYDNHT
jgi:hypothetical protein